MAGDSRSLSTALGIDFEDFFRAAPCFLTVQDRDFRIISANDLYTRTFGEGLGRHCYEAYKQRDSKCPECPVEATFVNGEVHHAEELVTLPDGRQIPIMAYTAPIRGPDGEISAVVEVSADITPVKMLERKLRESRERFRLLFEEVPCYMSVQDRELKIVQANRSFKEDFGDYVGAYCYEVYKHRGEPCLLCPVAKTFADGMSHQSEEVVTSRDGRLINTLVTTAPIRDAEGQIVQVMEVSTNITEIRNLQDQLSQLGLLVGSISHGVKGLLTGLDGGMYMMNTGFEQNKQERVEEGWNMIRRNVEQVRSVVLDLLYISKEREPDWERIDLNKLAGKIARLFRKKATDLGIDFQIDLARDAGEARIDAKSLEASIVNLLENAFDACRVDGRKDEHRVSFRLEADDGNVVFEIEDNGIGMDRETSERIFSLFFSSKGAEGTGLGLFIANKVVEKHGGTIEVDSEPGRGTRFLVRLPRRGRPSDS